MVHAGAVGVVGGAMKGCEAVTFTIRGDRPMRVAAAVRTSVSGIPVERWQRSVYLDREPRRYVLKFNDLSPVTASHSERPPLHDMAEVMWVVDDTHTLPGTKGRLSIDDVTIACGTP